MHTYENLEERKRKAIDRKQSLEAENDMIRDAID